MTDEQKINNFILNTKNEFNISRADKNTYNNDEAHRSQNDIQTAATEIYQPIYA